MNKHYQFEGGSISFNLTDEGLIIDVYDQRGEPIATEGMTAEEWAEWVIVVDHNRNI